jgi:hypothetical protein
MRMSDDEIREVMCRYDRDHSATVSYEEMAAACCWDQRKNPPPLPTAAMQQADRPGNERIADRLQQLCQVRTRWLRSYDTPAVSALRGSSARLLLSTTH